MWVQAVYNVIRERTSEFTVWEILPAWLRKFILDVDLEHIRLMRSRTTMTTTEDQ